MRIEWVNNNDLHYSYCYAVIALTRICNNIIIVLSLLFYKVIALPPRFVIT